MAAAISVVEEQVRLFVVRGDQQDPSAEKKMEKLLDTSQTSKNNQPTSPPRCVNVAVAFLKIGEIDTVKELYSADIYIQAHWREPLLDGKTADDLKKIDLKTFWNPYLYIENEMLERKSVNSIKVTTLNNEAVVIEQRKIRGDFLENLELHHFPLDCQELSIKVVTDLPDTDVELVPDERDISSCNTATFADKQEWKLYEHVETTRTVKTVIFGHSHIEHKHPAIKFSCHAARRAGFFCYNTFFIMFLIVAMSFGTFAVDCNLPQNRIQLTFTLVLTFIAYKMAISQSLPRISYLTYMDKYTLMSLCYLAVVSSWHALAGHICVDKREGSFYATKSEYWIIGSFFLLFLTGHVFIATFLYINAVKRRIKMAQKDGKFRRHVAGKVMAHQIAHVKRVSV